MKKFSLFLAFLFASFSSVFAQGEIEMATGLRSSGKIYVVVLVMLTIFFGVGLYLFSLDRKIKKLEDKKQS
ncbi:CcmD family protein [Sphingobacterium hungaricum]|uniref:CcmD family protein n=1 Tax=Sphingobacterium hungaricum TaxID=2082723 RepID=A0A928UV21_9SPHI|nr:CcmD family protein [Sphingobacterium hungaricum]MBE8713468.1 CcmD family protein [Sphingobacterium hungaricum]